MHARIAERIAKAARLAKDSVVFEIGPGTGMLTRELLKLAQKVIAVEADRELYEKLQGDFANEIATGRLELMHGDIRDVDLNLRYSVKDGALENYVVVANIPYYLTGEIFRMFLAAKNQPSAMTLLVQKEVAERVARSKKESILSLSIKAYGTPKYEFTVPRGAFRPAPKVDSAVLTIRGISRKNFVDNGDEERFFALLHAGFAHKRKFVQNNVREFISEKAIRAAGVDEGARAEDLSLEMWLKIIKEKNLPLA